MRVLIAEDEFIERKSMRKFIEENFSFVSVVGEAANGRHAIVLAEEVVPDIIFMDIKMPGIDGLEAIETINARDPSIKFIMISAYDSFTYAQEAMRFGIKDYILKPGNKEEIVKAILRIKKDIDTEKKRQQERMQSEQWMKEQFISGLMQHPVSEETIGMQKQLFPEMKSGFFFILMSDVDQDPRQVGAAMKSSMAYPFILLEHGGLLIVFAASPAAAQNSDILTAIRKLNHQLGKDIYIGVGYPYGTVEKLPSSYHEAYTAAFQLKADNRRNYGFMKTNDRSEKLENMIDQIVMDIEQGKGEEARLLYKEKALHFNESDKERLYIKLKKLLDDREIDIPNYSLSDLRSRDDLETFLNVSLMRINEFYTSRHFVYQVKTYLLNNFASDINLEDAAALVNLSTNYFSSVFKQETGETFIDHLTKIRLEKAKEFIEENAYSLKEISFMVGYKDPNYFSRVFKKYYDVSPSQFQQAIFKK